jgi:methionyl-tRNA formyltransferase
MGLRLAIFGQAPFGRDVTERLLEAGHEVVGVYAPPEKGRPDPLAALAEERGLRLLRHRRFRRKGEAIPELVEEYRSLGADLNILPFTTVILPPEIVDFPPQGSVCFHPSVLPAYRGGAALAWQIILGAEESGVTVFKVDAGVDEGPIVVQKRGVPISSTDTTVSLYFDKLYKLGVDAMVEAVTAIGDGTATFAPQPEAGASFQGLVDDEAARIDWSASAQSIDRKIRGCTPAPGALALLDGAPIRLFGARLLPEASDDTPGTILGPDDAGLLVAAKGGRLAIEKLKIGDAAKLKATEAELAPGTRLA